MARYTALYHSLSRSHPFSIHAAGCRDIKREADAHGSSLETFEAANLQAALEHMIDAELVDMGYTPDDSCVKCHDCARRASTTQIAGPSQADIDTACSQLQRELESPAMAAAIDGLEYLVRVAEAAAKVRAANQEYRLALRAARGAGLSTRQIAPHAGVSHTRVAQLTK